MIDRFPTLVDTLYASVGAVSRVFCPDVHLVTRTNRLERTLNKFNNFILAETINVLNGRACMYVEVDKWTFIYKYLLKDR